MGSMYRIVSAMSPVLELFAGADGTNDGLETHHHAREDSQSRLTQQLEELTGLLEDADVEYWVDSGTLLGLVREGDFIEWDKDIDLSIWTEDLPRLRSLWSRFKNLGYDPWPYYTGPPYVFSLVPKGRNGKIPVNIGGYRRDGDQAYRLVWGVLENGHPRHDARHWLNETYRFPLHAAVFLMRSRVGVRPLVGKWPWSHIIDAGYWKVPVHYLETTRTHRSGYRIPVKAEEYLSLRYGDWRTPVKDWDYRRDDGVYRSGVPPCMKP